MPGHVVRQTSQTVYHICDADMFDPAGLFEVPMGSEDWSEHS